MDQLIRDIKASELAKDFSRVYLPGEPEFEKRAQRLRTGVPMSTAVYDELKGLRLRLGLTADLV